MYLFTIQSRVNPKSKVAEELSNVGGAYVNCYVSFKDVAAAEKLARLLIRAQGWIPQKEAGAWKISRAKLKTKRERQYYSEALKYGYSLVFHTWPKDRDQ
jgi:hypothetical protein